MGENTIEIKATSVEGISTQVMRGTVTRKKEQSTINPGGSNTGNPTQNPSANIGNNGNGNTTNNGTNPPATNNPNPSTGTGQTITPN